MKKTFLIYSLIFITSFISCQKKNEQTKKDNNIALTLENSAFFKIDTLNGKKIIDNRCGVGAPNFKILKDSIYYFYPSEGMYYRIISVEKKEDFIIYHTKFPDLSITETRDFKIQKYSDYVKFYINNSYQGTFVDSNNIGKDIKYFNDKNCNNEEDEFPSIRGKWRLSCDDEITVFIKENSSSFIVADNQIAINMLKLPTSTKNEYLYRLDQKPTDMGSGGNSLNWDTYLNDKEIVRIKILNINTIEFHWLGFYNDKTKDREFLQIDITEEAGKNPLILNRCEN